MKRFRIHLRRVGYEEVLHQITRWSKIGERNIIYIYHYMYTFYVFLQEFGISNNIPLKFGTLQTCNKIKKTRSNGSTSSASRVSPVRRCQALSQSCTSAVIGGFTPLNLDPATWTQIPWSRSLYHWSITNGKGAHRVLFFLWNDGCLRCSTLVVWETPEIFVFFYLNQFQLSKDGSIISIFILLYINL